MDERALRPYAEVISSFCARVAADEWISAQEAEAVYLTARVILQNLDSVDPDSRPRFAELASRCRISLDEGDWVFRWPAGV